MIFDDDNPSYVRIKGKLLEIGLAIPGTIRETYLLETVKK